MSKKLEKLIFAEIIPDYRGCCGNWNWVNRETGETHVWKCNSGRCWDETCRQAWANRRIALICALLEEYNLTRFFTLTIPRNLEMDYSWEIMPYLWSKLRKRLKRYFKKAGLCWKSVAVMEAHKDGYPHIHGFSSQYIPIDILRHMWIDVGGGYIVDIRKVDDSVKVGEYVGKQLALAKYVGKQNLQDALKHLPKHHRTIWRSKGMKSQWEQGKPAPGSSKWGIDRRANNEAQWSRSNLETTLRKVSQGSFEESFKDLAAKRWQDESKRFEEVARSKRINQC